jgi:hypothetical protein
MKNCMNVVMKTVTAGVLALVAVEAMADVVLARTRPNNFTFTGPGPVLVPLNAAGATTANFNGSGGFTIMYTAECSNDAAGTGSWVSLQISVDNVDLAPSAGTSDAFCTSNGVGGHDGWVSAAMNVRTGNLSSGQHTVRVRASTVGGNGWVSDASLTVLK